MKHLRVFKSKKTNEYDLCCFYKVGLLGDLLNFPLSLRVCHLQAVKQIPAEDQGARASQSSGGIPVGFCHSHLSSARTAHQRQPQTPGDGAQGGCWQEGYQEAVLLPALYVFSSNDISYMNHIMCGHYHANYGCGQCLNKVFTTGQQLKAHQTVCMGLPKEAEDHTPASPEKECTSKDPSPSSRLPPPQSSQGSSQASLHQSQHSQKKSASTPKKADSATKSSKSGKEESRKKASKKSKWDKCCNRDAQKGKTL